MDATHVQVLTFDCYGTIVDWDRGIREAAAGLPTLEGCDLEQLLSDREHMEEELLAGPFRLYGAVLAESLARASLCQGRKPTDGELEEFAGGMSSWPLFEDSADALERLAGRFRLAILSNVENRVLARSVEPLASRGVTFCELVTAEDVGSYKPASKHFDVAHERLELPREAILHVAGSLYHDIRPARELGWNAVWIDRRGDGAPEELPGLELHPDLASFADAILDDSVSQTT